MPDIQCVRCGQSRAGLPYAPLNTDLGRRVQAEICQVCWGEWLKYQTMLIYRYGLNVGDPEAMKLLTENLETFLFSTGETERVATTQQGTIHW
jgi:Fe-S cluster biosynthesis and repair protein YggX